MVGLVAGMCGLFGGTAVEGMEFYTSYHRHGCLPWKRLNNDETEIVPEAGLGGYIAATVIRVLVVGAGLAWLLAWAHQISGPLGAVGVGVAAPDILGYLAKAVPLTNSSGQSGLGTSHHSRREPRIQGEVPTPGWRADVPAPSPGGSQYVGGESAHLATTPDVDIQRAE
jgi:hypothetical protein